MVRLYTKSKASEAQDSTLGKHESGNSCTFPSGNPSNCSRSRSSFWWPPPQWWRWRQWSWCCHRWWPTWSSDAPLRSSCWRSQGHLGPTHVVTACKERHGVRIGLQTLIAFTCCAGDNFHVKDGDQKLFGWRGAKGSLVLVLRRIGATLLSPTRMILFYAGGQSHTQLTNRHTQKHIHARARARTRTHHTHTHARTHAHTQTHTQTTHTHKHVYTPPVPS